MRKITIKTEYGPIEDQVLASITDLQQILINLIINAADASLDGSEILCFCCQKKNTIKIGVQDFGKGIEKENLDKIFDSFFTTKPIGKGTGLGLSVCQQLIARHQGEIHVESQKNQGSTFIMHLPARVAP